MNDLLGKLRATVGASRVLTTAEARQPYEADATPGLRGTPAAVVLPQDAAQVAAVMRLTRAARVPVVPRGAGTGLSGGCVAGPGMVVVSLETMNRILEVDAANHTLLCEPGVLTAKIDEAAAKAGLFYPPDPGSVKICTIGGNVAHNAGGMRGLKYGVTRNYVMGLEVVLPDGTITWLGSKCVKDAAGYSLKELFVGSEGTLGVITKILLKLLPRPAAKQTLLATFDNLEAAAETVSAIIAARVVPCTLEFLDRTTLRHVEAYTRAGFPAEAGALLLMEADGHPAAVEEEARHMAELARTHGALIVRRAQDTTEADRLSAARHDAYPALVKAHCRTILEDVTVPRSELAGMVRFVQATARRHHLECATFGHAGDGNLHPVFLLNDTQEATMQRAHAALQEMVTEALRRGGTVTGEHGVGLKKKAFVAQQRDAGSYALLKTIKRALDPENLLNPGKIVDLD